jgi:hypothetical protein
MQFYRGLWTRDQNIRGNVLLLYLLVGELRLDQLRMLFLPENGAYFVAIKPANQSIQSFNALIFTHGVLSRDLVNINAGYLYREKTR